MDEIDFSKGFGKINQILSETDLDEIFDNFHLTYLNNNCKRV